MWRVFRDIPKNFRQWNNSIRSTQNATQSRRDDDKENDEKLAGNHLQYRQYYNFNEKDNEDNNHGQHEQRAENDWRKKFEAIRLQQCLIEAAGWSTAVALGLHVSKAVHNVQKQQHDQDENKVCPTLARACTLALSMPYSGATSRSILSEDSSASLSKKNSETVSSIASQNVLQKAWADFEGVAKQYSATAYNIQGLQHAKQRDYASALHKWREGSELGHAKSQYNLGLSYELGRGTRRNLAKAAQLYNQASKLGHGRASYNLALMYKEGAGGLDRNMKKSLELMDKASDSGISKAQTYMGVHYIRKDPDKAVKLFSEASNKETEATYYLGLCYENGWGVPSSECKAAKLYSDAAKGGHSDALFNLGVFYENGLGGLPADSEAALDCYRQAEGKGSQSAKFNRQRLEAIAALELWAYEYSCAPSAKQPSSGNVGRQTASDSIHPSSSSPTLSDYAKEHFSDFHISGLDRQKSTSNVDLAYPNGKIDLDLFEDILKPTFTLGDDDNISDDGDDFIQFSDDFDVSQRTEQSWLGFTPNTNSANDMGCITCS